MLIGAAAPFGCGNWPLYYMLKNLWRILSLFTFLLIIIAVYNSNLREIEATDTISAKYTAFSLVSDGDIFLDEFPWKQGDSLPYYLYQSHDRIISAYPLATPLLASPIYYILTNYFNWRYGYSLNAEFLNISQEDFQLFSSFMAKISASIMTVFSILFIYLALGKMGVTRFRYFTCFIYALCTTTWSISSQSLWQHTGVELCFAAALYFSLLALDRIVMLIPAGLFLSLMIAARSIDILFAIPIVFYLIYHYRKENLLKACLLISPLFIITGLLLLYYNWTYFGFILGGEKHLELLHPQFHNRTGNWDSPILEGIAGILISPSRGLFIYSPILIFSFIFMGIGLTSSQVHPFLRFLVIPFFLFLLILSKYSVWWGGWSFGPRYFSDIQPLLAVFLGQGLTIVFDKLNGLSAGMKKGIGVFLILSASYSFSIQALGAFYYPCGWNNHPNNVDHNYQRLWNWEDTQISRCLKQSIHPPDFMKFLK